MKINEIIVEAATQYNPQDLWNPDDYQVSSPKDYTHLANIIETNCGQMLAAYREENMILWRGIGSSSTAIVANIRPDRVPVEMELKAHYALEKAFNMLGLKANRSNSIFCTTSADTAADWGKQFVIFVKDGWTGTVFEKLKYQYFYDRFHWVAEDEDVDIPELADMIKEVHPVVVTPANLPTVLGEEYKDILITGTSYIGLRYGTEPYLKVIELLNLHPIN